MFSSESFECCTVYNTEFSRKTFPDVEILYKGRVSVEFLAMYLKLYRNCAFLLNFHTRKLREISVFYAVLYNSVGFTLKYLHHKT